MPGQSRLGRYRIRIRRKPARELRDVHRLPGQPDTATQLPDGVERPFGRQSATDVATSGPTNPDTAAPGCAQPAS